MRDFINLRDSIKQLQEAGYGLVVALFIFVGVFTARKGVQGETMVGASIMGERQSDAKSGTTQQAERKTAQEKTSARVGFKRPRKMPIQLPDEIDTETLWLARVIYSETKRPREQELIAWTLRNRVETNYRGTDSYREAVLDPYQFSAFNPGSRKRAYYTNLTPDTKADGWERALAIAHHVRRAKPSARPFSKETRHFFSERSMTSGRTPNWAKDQSPVEPDRPYQIEAERFRFYEDIA